MAINKIKSANFVNKPLRKQTAGLIKITLQNPYLKQILENNPFPNNIFWYLGAGCICQTVWNYLTDKSLKANIKDYDLVYYDSSNITKKEEQKTQKRIKKHFSSLPIKLDIINQARVHTWYKKDFGKKIDQYKSCQDAINQWPTTATAIALNKQKNNFNVYAPYGLNDLFSMIVRPNKPHVIKWVYQKKIKKWKKIWPDLKIIPWQQI